MISNVVKTSTPQTNIKQGMISPAPMSTVQGQIKAPYSGLTTSTPANPAPKKTATTAPSAPTAQSYSNGVATPVAQAAPITSGNATTPSGAVVNAGTGGLVTPPPTVRGLVQPPSFGGIVGGLVDTSQRGSPQGTQYTQDLARIAQDTSAVDAANEELKKLRQGYATATGKIETTQGLPLEFVQGRSQVLGRQFASQEAAAQAALSNALTARGQSISGLQQAGGLALQGQGLTQQGLTSAGGLVSPVQVPYSNQFINPLTGQPVSGAGSASLNDAVALQIQKLRNGTTSYDQAVSDLGAYGQAGINALQQQLGPNFNVAQSNVLAGQQGSIKPAFDYAKSAITNLQNAVKDLYVGQATNVPIINSITQGISTTFGVGSTGVQAYKGALAEARSAIQKVLASVQGGTPTDYVGQSNALLPDNATPNQIQAALETLNTLGQAKVDIYGNPGFSGTNTGTTGGSGLYDW